jgi:transitional endoplasmic reticulum ATPase
LEQAIVTATEAAMFGGLDGKDGADFYRQVAALSPVRIRQAMRYAVQQHEDDGTELTIATLRDTLREFRAHRAAGFEIPGVSFADIGGYQEIKNELRDAIRLITEIENLPASDRRLAQEIAPHGFLFHGPPGTGKTLFAQALANALNGVILHVSGPEVLISPAGDERTLREIFVEAESHAPSVIFFDEFDALAARRLDYPYRTDLVSQILTLMDGLRPDVAMLVVASTNRLDLIDPALLRPGRFRNLRLDLPDTLARRSIIDLHAARYRIDVGELTNAIVDATDGLSGDELRSVFQAAYVARWVHGEPFDTPDRMAEKLGTLVGSIHRTRRSLELSSTAPIVPANRPANRTSFIRELPPSS